MALLAYLQGEVQTGEDAEKVTELKIDFSKPQSASNSVKNIKLKIITGRNVFLQKIHFIFSINECDETFLKQFSDRL